MTRAFPRLLAPGVALVVALVAALTLGGCAPDLRSEYPFDGETVHGDRLSSEALGNGVTKTTVDSSAKEAWVYVDLDAMKELSVDEALSENGWDLQFQRFKIYSNSGVHGSGGVGVAVLPGANFDELTRAPEDDQFQADADDPSTENDSPFLAGDGWYLYDLLQHKLKARPTVYVVRTTAGAHLKLQFTDYYSSSGDAGHLSFEWARLDP